MRRGDPVAGTQESKAVSFWVYILASRRNGTLYIGMTDDLVCRSWEHRTGAVPGFTIPAQSTNLEIWVPAFAGTNGGSAALIPPSD